MRSSGNLERAGKQTPSGAAAATHSSLPVSSKILPRHHSDRAPNVSYPRALWILKACIILLRRKPSAYSQKRVHTDLRHLSATDIFFHRLFHLLKPKEKLHHHADASWEAGAALGRLGAEKQRWQQREISSCWVPAQSCKLTTIPLCCVQACRVSVRSRAPAVRAVAPLVARGRTTAVYVVAYRYGLSCTQAPHGIHTALPHSLTHASTAERSACGAVLA